MSPFENMRRAKTGSTWMRYPDGLQDRQTEFYEPAQTEGNAGMGEIANDLVSPLVLGDDPQHPRPRFSRPNSLSL